MKGDVMVRDWSRLGWEGGRRTWRRPAKPGKDVPLWQRLLIAGLCSVEVMGLTYLLGRVTPPIVALANSLGTFQALRQLRPQDDVALAMVGVSVGGWMCMLWFFRNVLRSCLKSIEDELF